MWIGTQEIKIKHFKLVKSSISIQIYKFWCCRSPPTPPPNPSLQPPPLYQHVGPLVPGFARTPTSFYQHVSPPCPALHVNLPSFYQHVGPPFTSTCPTLHVTPPSFYQHVSTCPALQVHHIFINWALHRNQTWTLSLTRLGQTWSLSLTRLGLQLCTWTHQHKYKIKNELATRTELVDSIPNQTRTDLVSIPNQTRTPTVYMDAPTQIYNKKRISHELATRITTRIKLRRSVVVLLPVGNCSVHQCWTSSSTVITAICRLKSCLLIMYMNLQHKQFRPVNQMVCHKMKCN
jgi:hypothetical protein